MTASISSVSSSLVLLLKMVTRSTLPFPCDRLDLPEGPQLALARALKLLHLVDRGLVRPESVAPVDQHDGLGDALKVDRPVEGRVAAADEQHPLALELLRVEHLEVETLLLERVLALDAEPPGLERADPGGDDDGARWGSRLRRSPARSGRRRPSSTRRRPVTISPRCVVAPNWSAWVAMSRTRSLASTLGKPATSKMYFSGYSAMSWPPSAGSASMMRAEAPRIPA